MDNFCQSSITTNTKIEYANAILTSERLNNSDALAETLKIFKINDARYYESEKNVAKGDPASNPKVATHTSDRKKKSDTSNGNLKQILLSNRTLPIITITIDPRIPDMVETCGGTPHAIVTLTTKEVITDVAQSSSRVVRIPGHVNKTGKDGTTLGKCDVSVRSPRPNFPVIIIDTTISPACGIIGSLEILNKHGSTGSVKFWG